MPYVYQSPFTGDRDYDIAPIYPYGGPMYHRTAYPYAGTTPTFDPSLYEFAPQVGNLNTIPSHLPYPMVGVNPWVQGVQMGVLGSAMGLGIGAIQQGISRWRGVQGDGAADMYKPMMIGALIGSALGTMGGFKSRRAQMKDNSGMTWGQISQGWPKHFSDNSQGISRGLIKLGMIKEAQSAGIPGVSGPIPKGRIERPRLAYTADKRTGGQKFKDWLAQPYRQWQANRANVEDLQRMHLDPEYRRIAGWRDPKKGPADGGFLYNLAVNPGHKPGDPNIGLGPLGGTGVRDQFLGSLAVPAAMFTPAPVAAKALAVGGAAHETNRSARMHGAAAGMKTPSGKVLPGLEGQYRRARMAGNLHAAAGTADLATLGLASKLPWLRHVLKGRYVMPLNLAANVADPEMVHPGYELGTPVPGKEDIAGIEGDIQALTDQLQSGATTNQPPQGISRSLIEPVSRGAKRPVGTMSDIMQRYQKALAPKAEE